MMEYGHTIPNPMADRYIDPTPLPDPLAIVQTWTFWDLKAEIARLDKNLERFRFRKNFEALLAAGKSAE